MIRFKVRENKIAFRIKEERIRMCVSDAVLVSGVADPYEGEYIITPKLEPQVMETKDKMMKENVTVEKIPIVAAPNSAGGNTVIIGG